MSQLLDRDTLRGRIQAGGSGQALSRSGPAPQPQQFGAVTPERPRTPVADARPYIDRDATDQTSIVHPRLPQQFVPGSPPPDTAFEDLDDQPLPGGRGASMAATASPTEPGSSAPLAADPATPPDATAPHPDASPPPPDDAVVLDPPAMRRIVYLATARPGETPPFSRAQPNLDGEGLRYGIGRFSQASGALGALLAQMRSDDAVRFDEIFGDPTDDALPHPDVEALLDITQAPIPDGSDDRSARLAEVSGRPLWDPAWIRKFKQAADVEAFQAAQYRMTAQRALLPMLEFARDLDLASERGLTMLTERAILLGVAGAQDAVIDAAGPLNTDALRAAALAHVAADPGAATVAAFQDAAGVTEPRGHFGARTHAALVRAVRESDHPPIQLPSADLMLDQIVGEAHRSGLPGLLPDIRANTTLSDGAIAPTDPVME